MLVESWTTVAQFATKPVVPAMQLRMSQNVTDLVDDSIRLKLKFIEFHEDGIFSHMRHGAGIFTYMTGSF